MKIKLALSALLLTSFWCTSQPIPIIPPVAPLPPTPQPPPPMVWRAPTAPSEVLDANYVVHLEIIREGARSVEVKLVTARGSFQLNTGKPSLSLTGTLRQQKEGRVYLEYSVGTTSPTDNAVKPPAKTQNNNQMFASGLASFIFKSTLSYAPSQQLEKESEPANQGNKTTCNAGVLLALGKPITILVMEKEVYKISVEKLGE